MKRESKLYAAIGQNSAMHLVGWIHTQFPLDKDIVFEKMADYIIAQDAEDRERLLNLGWWKVYDESTLNGQREG